MAASWQRAAWLLALLHISEALHSILRTGAASAPEAFQALDADGSGTVTEAEVENFARMSGLASEDLLAEFQSLDKNGDGLLQMSELEDTVSNGPKLPEAKSPETVSIQNSAIEVQEQASSVLASKFAETVQKVMARYHEHEDEASQYEDLARRLRGNATTLVRQVPETVRTAAKSAAQKTVEEAMREVRELHEQASMAENEAQELQGQAAKAMEGAQEAQRGLNSEVMQLDED
mmetsp:Transcript_22103/g.40617  ORF Transcript_22103/g.40617 Transcript_22103/m.40617 type:complete len:234 (-) Transcript_22103:102-803(-)